MSATTIIVNDETPRRQYTATGGQTIFDFPFPVFEAGDLDVYLTPVGNTPDDASDLLTITTNYTVSGVNTQDSCVVTLTSGATAGDIITIVRVVDVSRTADYQTSGDLLAETLNREQDEFVMIAQQLRADLDRCIIRPTTSTETGDLALPPALENYILGWDSTGSLANFQEIGSYKGTDATTTTVNYVERDLVKSTTAGQLDNVYICIQDAPAGTLLTNTSFFSLIIDAVSAATSAANAAASESAAATSASTATTQAGIATTQAGIATTQAGLASTSAGNAATSESNAATSATDADLERQYAAEWANKAEDSLVSVAAGGDNVDDYSALHHANKAAASAASAAATLANAVTLDGDQTITGSKRGAVTTDNDLSYDMAVGNNFVSAVSASGTLTFTNITAGQSGNITLTISGTPVVSAAATTRINATELARLSTAGVYRLSYYSPDGTNVDVSVSSALTGAGA